MPSIIDNRNRTMLTALQETIPQSESIDIITAYFYFSGFNALADELKDKKVRILVGKTVDPTVINELCQAVKFNPKVLLICLINPHYQKSLIRPRVRLSLKCSSIKSLMDL